MGSENIGKTGHCSDMESLRCSEKEISKIKPYCCSEKISAFSNSNILSEVKTSTESKVSYSLISFTAYKDVLKPNHVFNKTHIQSSFLPKADIHILLSSLLI